MAVAPHGELECRLLPHQGGQHIGRQLRGAPWYRKDQASFLDTIAPGRRWLWREEPFGISGKTPEMIEIPRELFERLTDTISYAD